MRLLRILIIKQFRHWKKLFGMAYLKILVFAGLTPFQFSDSLFFGSICLLFFRFFFRLFFSFNPFWGLNFCVYLLGLFIQLKYNILKNVRENFIEILKMLLGKNYWRKYTVQELLTLHKLYYPNIPDINIFETSLFNKGCQKLFIFFIFFRLWLLKIPYKFIFFNCLLTLFLIFNEFFLFSSCCSFLIILSRLCFFASDYTIASFYESINLVEKINTNTEYIESSWDNAELIALIITRNFHKNFAEKHFFSKKFNISDSVFTRYIQINQRFKKYSDEIPDLIFYNVRKHFNNKFLESNGKLGAPYKEVLKIKRKKKFSAKFLLMVGLPVWFPEFIKQRDSLQYYYNSTKSNFFDFLKFPYLNQRAQNHPVSFGLFKNLLLRLNESTPKQSSDRPFLGLLPTFEKNVLTGRGIMRTCSAKELTMTELSLCHYQIEMKLKDGSIKERNFSNDFLPNLVSININSKILEIDALRELFDLHTKKKLYILPEWFNAGFLAFLDPTCDRLKAIYGMDLGIKYLELQIKNPHWTGFDKENFSELLFRLKNGRIALSNLTDDCFGDGSNKILDWKLFLLNQINQEIEANITKPPVPIIEKTIKNLYIPENPEYFVELHFSNYNHISKEFGGKDKITHKGLFPDQYTSSIVIPAPISPITPSDPSSAVIPFNSHIQSPENPGDGDM